MSGRERMVSAMWSPPPRPVAAAVDPSAAAGRHVIGSSSDAAEAEADRVAAAVGRMAAVPARIGETRPASIQRQTPVGGQPDSGAAAVTTDQARAQAELKRLLDVGLAEAVKVEPLAGLIAQGRDVLATPGGKAALGEIVASLITGFALAHRPLPITSYTQDLGDIATALRGAKVKLTWEGPTDDPTKAGVEITYAPPSGPLQGASVTGTAQGGSSTATGGGGTVRYAPPGGPLAGGSVSIGASGTQGGAVRGEVGVGYTAPRGPLRGMETRVTGSLDSSGAAGVGVSITIPLGTPTRRSGAQDERAAELEQLRSANRAMVDMRTTPAEREAARRREDEEVRAWLTRPGSPVRLQRVADPGGSVADPSLAGHHVDATLAESGEPLPAEVRAGMESAMGQDFSRVRVHTGDRASASTRAVGAIAYTVGPHVVLGTDRWQPHTPTGRSLLAHELTHVVQQGEAAPR